MIRPSQRPNVPRPDAKVACRSDHEEEKGDYYRREISQGSFERILAIPANVDSDKAKAKFRDGILELSLPKTEKSNRKKIAID